MVVSYDFQMNQIKKPVWMPTWVAYHFFFHLHTKWKLQPPELALDRLNILWFPFLWRWAKLGYYFWMTGDQLRRLVHWNPLNPKQELTFSTTTRFFCKWILDYACLDFPWVSPYHCLAVKVQTINPLSSNLSFQTIVHLWSLMRIMASLFPGENAIIPACFFKTAKQDRREIGETHGTSYHWYTVFANVARLASAMNTRIGSLYQRCRVFYSLELWTTWPPSSVPLSVYQLRWTTATLNQLCPDSEWRTF